MKLADSRKIGAPRERVYAALNDPEVLSRAIPGCERLDKISDNQMSATVALKIGPVKARFEGEVRLENLNPPESYTIVGSGKGGAAGFASGAAAVHLAEADGATLLSYELDAKIGGKLAQLGSRLVEGAARKLAGEFFGRFAEAVEGAPGDSGAQAPAPRAAAGLRALPPWAWGAMLAAALAAAALAFWAA